MLIRNITGTLKFLLIVLVVVISSPAQATNNAEGHLRRAERLLPILLDVDSVEDPAMRVLIRFECLDFIYGQRHPTLHDRSDSEVLKFYADLVPEKRPVRYRLNSWQNSLLTLLRKNRPELAKQVETTYLKDEDISDADYREIKETGNVRDAVDRAIDRMRRDISHSMLPYIEQGVRTKNPAEADRLINAAFDASERPGSVGLPIDSILRNRSPEFFDKWLPQLRTRYLRLIVNVVRTSGDEGNQRLFETAKSAMNRNYENFLKYAPEMVEDVEALSRPSVQRGKDFDTYAAEQRIVASVDRVKQSLTEADSVSDHHTKYQLLSRAMTYAGETKQFTRAVEIAEVARKYVSPTSTIVDWDLWQRVLPRALSQSDLKDANLIISKINSDAERAGAIADLARVHARANRKDEAIKLVRQAYMIIEKNPEAVVPATVIFHLVDPAFIAEPGEGFDAARRSIVLANRMPEPKPSEKIGGNGYQTYADHVLVPIGISIGSTFAWMASKDLATTEPQVMNLKYSPWRLLARIAIEKNRPQELPPEMKSTR
jgi:hypothetical protein